MRGLSFMDDLALATIAGRKTETRRPARSARCPYGQPGDILFVRERYCLPVMMDAFTPSQVKAACMGGGWDEAWAPVKYLADGRTAHADELDRFGGRWGRIRVAKYMPRWLSRAEIRITAVHCERLWSITNDSARAEGVSESDGDEPGDFRGEFRDRWDRLYARTFGTTNDFSWSANPDVWVVKYRIAVLHSGAFL